MGVKVILEEEIIMYEDDPRLLAVNEVNEIKVDDYIYYWLSWLINESAEVKSLEDAKKVIVASDRDIVFLLDIGRAGSLCRLFSFDISRKILICNYCGGDVIVIGKMEVFLRKITIYKRPPKGAKDMKIKHYIRCPYIYRQVGTPSAYCKKCGSTE